MYELTELGLGPPPGLEFRPYRPEGKPSDLSDLVILKFDGEYPPGSRGNRHGRYISAMTVASLVAFSPCCVILDFTDLKYVWGNTLLEVFDDYHRFVHEPGEQDLPLLVVTGERSRRAFLSLVTPADSNSAPPWHFDSLDIAIEAGLIAAREWLDS